MTDFKLPADVRGFVQACVSDIDSAELLLLLARERNRALSLRKITASLSNPELEAAAVARYLAGFVRCGLVERAANAYRWAPSASAYDDVLAELGRLYNEQPVTLVRMIYAPKDERLRAFSDAFKIGK